MCLINIPKVFICYQTSYSFLLRKSLKLFVAILHIETLLAGLLIALHKDIVVLFEFLHDFICLLQRMFAVFFPVCKLHVLGYVEQ